MGKQQRWNVMVVDDDVASAFLTTCQLEESNLFDSPLVYTDPNQALKYVESTCVAIAATQILPYVVLLDVHMPGKDGTVRRRG